MTMKKIEDAVKKNYIWRYLALFSEYEEVKRREHKYYNKVKTFYEDNKLERKTFLKYYNRYIESWRNEESIFPQKRWPRYKTRRIDLDIEEEIVKLRKLGNNRYEIHSILKPKYKWRSPSCSGIYNVFKRYKLNRMNHEIKEQKQQIITKKMWELWHIDCHYLKRWIIKGDSKRYYLVWLIDDYTRIVECQITEDLKALTVMFAWLRCINLLNWYYWIEFESILSDNWVEFGSKQAKDKKQYPFERMLMELWIKHKYTRPYRPETNGKIERFWRIIEEEFLEWSEFENIEELKDELMKYVYYYNNIRAHWSLEWQSPFNFTKNLLPN